MPATTAGKVLVTGANGYIAVWVVKSFLDKGYSVRGTVRSESKTKHLTETFKAYGDRLEVVVVEDITKEDAFDEAVKGVDAIAHTASPFHLNADDPNELITPAVKGTLSVLQSALKYGTTVKRIVVTSSTAAVISPDPNPRVFSEDDWNDPAIKEVEEKGRDASAASKYRASKTLAERAAWDFVQKNKSKIGWDLVVLNPPYVFGPTLHELDDPEKLNTSMLDWWSSVVKGRKDNETLASVGSEYVDVRDIALAHVLALQKEAAGGHRIIISSGPWKWQDWVNAARSIDANLPAGNTSYDPSKATHTTRYDTSRASKLLGIGYFGIAETTRDVIAQFKEKGWVA
ncbi:hypothetical protein PHLCEN_2v5173 [Hermanssonia centrifuga]|uniref:NAD-dependent epimerase/dehydratase domain-containing protein n=1 Tax=Hermanssonia centrifuga TaxID=98765 RepID=A0A2R6P8U3_9APHY|nr:hypothetical protein PHLCEN_2v5173 [Hermanssonia centrifuga]